MANHGKVRTFNQMTGTGFISPEGGGEQLPFRQIDVCRPVGVEVHEGQRLAYEISVDLEGESQAINLRLA